MRAISVVLALLVASPLYAASRFDPALRFRTLTTEHFVIYFHQGEDALAARLARIAEEIRREMQQPLGLPAQKRTHVVLVDQTELSNGWAFPLPYNTVAIHAAWPAGSDFIGHVDDWLRMVFAHEYSHIVHLDRSGGWARFVRRLFGRTPLAFPNLFLPQWQIEGLATYQESALTGAGRLYAGDFRAVEREAARGRALEPIDRVGGGLTSWPDGIGPYAYGLGFHEHLARTYGAERLQALAEATARRLPFLAAGAYPKIYGKPLHVLWREYQDGVAISRSPSTTGAGAARLTRHGFTVVGPRFAPPSCATCPPEVVYSVRTPDGFPSMNAITLDGSPPRRLATRYLGSTTGVAAGFVVFDQQELRRNVALHSDLYLLDRLTGGVRKLTNEARLVDPDVSPDGGTIACVREGRGRRELVTVRLRPAASPSEAAVPAVVSGFGGSPSVLLSELDTQFNAPRWAPHGRTIAVERHRPGRPPEVIVVNAADGSVRVVASDPSIRFVTPAWRPDGRAILVAGARAGEPFNLYEVELSSEGGAVRQLTTTTGGATWPDVSPDGATIVFVGYTLDGFDLFTMPYPDRADTTSLKLAATASETRDAEPTPDAAPELRTTGSYNPISTLLPTSWSPVIESSGDDLRVGAAIGGYDVLGYHAYAASATWRVSQPATAAISPPRVDWSLAYAYDRWRPTFFLNASSDTSFGSGTVLRTQEAEAGVVVPLRRVRIAHEALASIVRIVDRHEADDTLRINRTAARVGWFTSTARVYGYSVSPEHGVTAGLAAEFVRPALGASERATTLTADWRAYLPGIGRRHVVALRAGGGRSTGAPFARRLFFVGGAAPNASVLDFDGDAFSLLRGFEPDSFAGTRVAVVNADYRWPLARPERGVRTWPVFLHTLHGAVFADAAHAWSRRFRANEVKTSAGGELAADVVLGYSLRVTVAAGAAWGRDGARAGSDRATVYVRAGRAF